MSFMRESLLHRYLDWEHALTIGAHRLHAYRMARSVFGVASRLGDGMGWYAIMAILVVIYGKAAWIPVVWMLGTALVGFGLYWAIKKMTARPRPCDVFESINLSVAPLDKYSFPRDIRCTPSISPFRLSPLPRSLPGWCYLLQAW